MTTKRRIKAESSAELSRKRHDAVWTLRLTAPATDETDADEIKNSGGGEQ